MSSGSGSAPLVRVNDGTGRTFEFNDQAEFKLYLDQTNIATSQSLTPLLDEFKTFPSVDQVLVTYFTEALSACESKQRIAGCILVGCLSELLVLRLLKTIGNYLGDPNSVSNYDSKKNNIQSQFDYAKQMILKGKTKLETSTQLTQTQTWAFNEFNTVFTHVFDSIRLRRNEYAHPKSDMSLDSLPLASAVKVHTEAFNQYAKILLLLIDTFQTAIP